MKQPPEKASEKTEPLALIASKAIMRMRVSTTAKTVAALLLDHVNWQDFRCDPGATRLARLGGHSRSNVQVAIKRLQEAGILNVRIHGGRFGTNQYDFNWDKLRESDAETQAALKRSDWSPRNPQPERSAVRAQTRSANPFEPEATANSGTTLRSPRRRKEQAGGEPIAYSRVALHQQSVTVSRRDAAVAAAEGRWSQTLTNRLRNRPEILATALSAIDPTVSRAATEAEATRRGAGLRYILKHLQRLGQFGGPLDPGEPAGISRSEHPPVSVDTESLKSEPKDG